MNIDPRLQQFGEVPFSHGALQPLLADYRRPNDKISEWLADETLVAIKRGVYVLNPRKTGQSISLILIANQLYGPSYVSLDYALSYYGLIPETVYEITSVTTRRAKRYDTALGRFSYAHSALSMYPLGIRSVQNEAGHYVLMASPEKALCDKLIQTPNLIIRSPGAMRDYLDHDLRLDLDAADKFDLALLQQIASAGIKRRLLETLCHAIEQ